MPRPAAEALAVAVLGCLCAAAPGRAEPELFPTFSARLGAFALSGSTTVRLDGAADILGDAIDFEDDFGVDDNVSIGTLSFEWQPLEHHLFRVGWYAQKRDGSRSIDDSFEFGGVTYPVGAEVSAEFKETVWELDWTWWMLKRDNGALGMELGVTALDYSVEANARVRVGNHVRELHESGSAIAPVPTIGIAGRTMVFGRLFLEGEARILPGVNIDNVSGDAFIFIAAAEWFAFEHVGFGLAWSSFSIDAEVDDSHYRGDLELTEQGLKAYVRVNF